MKRIFLVTLALVLCLSALPAFADSSVNITIDAGDHSPVDVNVNSIDGCNNNAVINDGAACGATAAVIPCVKPSCVIINGVPSCIEPKDPPCVDPDYCARMARHSCLKNAARDVFAYLEGRLNQIGWWHKTYKFVRSFETRVIYGSRGDNNHYSERRPITFYYKADPSIKVKAYLNVYKHGKNYMTVFTTDFTPAKKCSQSGYSYPDDLMITGIYADGYDAVDEFIAQLERLASDTDVDDDADS
ncbi:hypothetical protein IIZ77_01275 [Candidatus Saccharibacteria bacterium]|nr:hypothetical protein [Candidatus Saccharibacteria bacterium]